MRKHAQVKQVEIRFSQTAEGSVRVEVEDDGHGFDPSRLRAQEQHHYGLRVMQERAEEVGGRFQLRARPGRGVCIILELSGQPQHTEEPHRRPAG